MIQPAPESRPEESPSQAAEGELQLKVAESASRDVGRAIARLDPADLRKLGRNIGEPIAIMGARRTVCRAMPAFADDRGKGLVMIDGITRENAGVGLDDSVTIEPCDLPVAETVTLTPLQDGLSKRDTPYIGSLLDGITVTRGNRLRAQLFGSRSIDFHVEQVSPGPSAVIQPGTVLKVPEPKANRKQDNKAGSKLSYEDIGGLKPQIARIREMIELPLRFPEVFQKLGIDPPKGVLMHGPPGCGKTLIAKTIAQECDAAFFSISGPEIHQKLVGQSEGNLRKVFDEAGKHPSAIIFIDEIDSIAPKREDSQQEVERRVVAQLLTLMDGLKGRRNVIVIAATNLPNHIDPALRRPGRFDREITINIPDLHGRREILEVHSRGMPLDDSVELYSLAEVTHGYVGADLAALCREAAMACLRQVLPDIDFQTGSIPYERITGLKVTREHFDQALHEVEPSAVREVFVEVPNVSWDDIGGLAEVKARLIEAVEWPLQHAELFEQAGIRPSRGILLAGPPGVGKTMLAKAVATQTRANFISIKGPELMSKYVGESERGLRDLFRKARQASPCIMFFDEVDAILASRGETASSHRVSENLLSQFLAEMDGVEELRGVLILGATNRLTAIDPAARRPGRFDHIIEFGLPDFESREAIFAVHTARLPLAPDTDRQTLCQDLAQRMDHASGAEIAEVCRRAALAAIRRAVDSTDPATSRVCVHPDDFMTNPDSNHRTEAGLNHERQHL